MAYPRRDQWSQTLADASGVWCAVCFRTIPPGSTKPSDVVEQHHVVQKEPVQRLFSPDPNPADDWTVPVCRGCHASAAAQSQAAAKTLVDACLGDMTRIDQWVGARHDRSDYSRSLLAKLYVLKNKRASLDPTEYAVLLEHAWSSAAGVAWLRVSDAQLIEDVTLVKRPTYCLNKASYAAAFGMDQDAIAWFNAALDCIGSLPKAQRERYDDSRKRRAAQTTHDTQAAQESVAATKNQYSQSTGFILQAAIPLLHGHYVEARDAVIKFLFLSDRPLLYDALAYFMLGVMNLADGTPRWEQAYTNLVCTQYIVVMLGLNGRLPLSNRGGTRVPPSLTAGALLCSEVFDGIDSQRRFELRRESLGDHRSPSSVCFCVDKVLTA